MRDHEPIVIEEFNGWYKRGDADSVPPDHFVDAINIDYIDSGFKSRNGIEPWIPARSTGERDILRIYAFSTDDNQGLLSLDTNGDIYFVVPSIPSSTFVLHVDNMTDFGFVSINGFAYISPSTNDSEQGIDGEFVYVYDGTSSPARKAAGVGPVNADGALAAANSATAGNVEAGIHIFGVVYETDSGFLTQIGPDTLPTVTAPGNKKVDLSNIPVSPSSFVVARHIVASKLIDPTLYTGDTRGYELFFVPDGAINDNTSTTLTVNFFDSELLESAAHLLEILSEIPAGGGLGTYHNRMIVWAIGGEDYSLAYLSSPGEPEAINAVDGLITLPRNTKGITQCSEYRDILYVFKIDECNAYSDNGDVPSSWQQTIIDSEIGCAKHGMARMGEGYSTNIEYLLLASWQGVFIFNGTFQRPEFSYKIEDFWVNLDEDEVHFLMEVHNDVKHQIFYINFPEDFLVLVGNYKNGFDAAHVRWSKYTFNVSPDSMTLFDNANELLIASQGNTTGL